MMVSFIEIIFLLASLGVFAAIVLLVAFAIIAKRPVLAVAAAVMMFLVVGVGMAFVGVFAYQSQGVPHAAHVEQLIQSGSPPINFEQHIDDGSAVRNVTIGTAKGITFAGLLLVLALPVVGIIALISWLKSRNTACRVNEGGRRGFPVFAIILIAIVLFGGFRFRTASDAASQAQRHAMEVQRDIERTDRERTRERIRVPSPPVNLQNNAELKSAVKQLSAEQRQVALQLAEAHRQVTKYIDNTDIHELMDKFDAPRIYLSSPSSSSGTMIAVPMSVLLPFQLIKQIATSTPEAPTTPEVPATPELPAITAQPAIPPAPPVPVAAPTLPVAVVEPARPPLTEVEKPSQNAEEPLNTMILDPKQTVDASTGRPHWINAPSETVGGRWTKVIEAGDYATEEEAQAETNARLRAATNDYIKQFARALSPNIDHQDPLAIMGLGTDYLRREVAKAQYVETVERSVGPMKKLYTRMEISPTVDRELHKRWNAYQRHFRMGTVGIWAASILGVVGLALGLLKIDTATKGYYTKLLFIGVPVAIIGFMFLMLLVVA